ncbi:MAG TPA: hypothetical protein VF739_16780 [Ktedonobacterales bacterium]
MRKAQINRLWIVGVIVCAIGLIVGGISVGLMLANGGTWVQATDPNNATFVPRLDGFFWTTVGFTVIGGVIMLVGALAQLVAWIAALVNTYPLPDKTWFVVLLVGGLVGVAFGLAHLAVMIAYVIAGPDEAVGQHAMEPAPPPMTAPTTLVPMR